MRAGYGEHFYPNVISDELDAGGRVRQISGCSPYPALSSTYTGHGDYAKVQAANAKFVPISERCNLLSKLRSIESPELAANAIEGIL